MDTTIRSLNKGWRFYLGECDNAWYKGFDDSSFRPVTLPHDWSVEQPFSQSCSSGTGYLPGGTGWYRLHFNIPQELEGKNIRVVFDGVYKNSQVWVNSYYLGKHPYGYTDFSYDISKLLHFGDEENVVCVKVTHKDIADSRWFTGSGITRKVSLIVSETVHPAYNGIYFMTDSLTADSAQISVHHEVEGLKNAEAVKVETKLFDACEKEVLVLEKVLDASDKLSESFLISGNVENPALWSVACPQLYTMKTYYTVDGSRYLVDEQRVGIRKTEFDAQKGFFLNGEPMKLKGVCVHHDAGVLGAAVKREVWQRRLEKLKKSGCNAIRCSHNPHMPELYELCDEMGFLVMDEAFDEWENAKNKWSTGHNVYPPKHQGYFEDFPEWHERDLRAMVRRDRVHPSVIMWSIGNEIDYPNDPYCHPDFAIVMGNNDANKPAAERQYNADKPDARRMIDIAAELVNIVKDEDKSRPVTMALAFPELSKKLGIFDLIDVAGYNYKEQFYGEDHAAFPDMPLLGSENSQSYEAWKMVLDNDYISGQFLWTGVDFLGEAYGWPIHGSAAGMIDLAGFEKSWFLLRKSFWCEEPVVELVTRRAESHKEFTESWNYEDGDEIEVHCYSNLPEVELYINSQAIAKQSGYNTDGAFAFKVPYKAGSIEARGCKGGAQIASKQLKTSTAAYEVSLNEWKPESLVSQKAPTEGGYLHQIEVSLLGKDKARAVCDDRWLSVSVEGAGELAGIENGDLADNTAYALASRKTKAGRALIYVRRIGEGSIRVTAKAEGIPSKTVLEL